MNGEEGRGGEGRGAEKQVAWFPNNRAPTTTIYLPLWTPISKVCGPGGYRMRTQRQNGFIYANHEETDSMDPGYAYQSFPLLPTPIAFILSLWVLSNLCNRGWVWWLSGQAIPPSPCCLCHRLQAVLLSTNRIYSWGSATKRLTTISKKNCSYWMINESFSSW